MKTTRGMGTPVMIALIAIAFVVVGSVYYNTRPEGEIMIEEGKEMSKEGKEMMEDGEVMKKDGEAMVEEGEKMMEKNGDTMMKEEGAMMEKGGYEGQVLAGSVDGAVLLDFTEADYKKAQDSGKLITLYFYATWCPICVLEFPKMKAAFNELGNAEVIGFRVNYNDSKTDDAEKGLAREFGVAYQHTKVFVKNGERTLKSPDGWSKDRYLTEINNALK